MKTQSSAKMLACLLMLLAVPAVATVVNINTDHTDYTFASGTTYFVDANVTLYGTTTFEGGAVLKYNSSGQINIDSGGTVVCPSGADAAIFTSYNDNTVGETVSGSSGTPAIGDVNTFLDCSAAVTLSRLRFCYSHTPLAWFSDAAYTLQSCEFFHDADVDADWHLGSPQIFNCLFVDVAYMDWFPSSDNDTAQNNTFVNCGVIFDSWASPATVVTSDNLFDSTGMSDWTSGGTTGGNNAFYNCTDYLGGSAGLPTDITLSSAPGYQIGPLGDYYLPCGSPLIDAGDMLATDAGLDAFTTQTTQTPDSGMVDIGYHYPVTDQNYVVLNSDRTNFTFLCGMTYFVDSNIMLYGTSTFESGTVLKYNTNGQINIPSTGTIVCPTGGYPATFTSYNDNTIGAMILGSSGTPGIYNIYTETGNDVNTFLNVTNVTLSNMRFSYAYSPFEGYATVTLQNCEFFYDAYMYVQSSQIFNNLFVEVDDLDWFPGSDNDTMQNNTFVNSGVFLDSFGYPTTTVVSDNLFDSTGVSDWTYNGATGGNNAFYNCTDYLGPYASGLPTDTTYSGEPGYLSGPLGDYYLPTDSPLIDAGDMLATDAGLDAFTTQTTQTPDSGTVDIGYHYFVLDSSCPGTDLTVNSSVTPQQLVQMLLPPWATAANVTYTGADQGRGTFCNGLGCRLPLDKGVILASGDINNAIGPNNASGTSTAFGTNGDSDLDSLVGGGSSTHDAAVLEFDIVPTNSFTLKFQYVFASEEYPEYIGPYNDPMAIFVSTNFDGTNWINSITNDYALVPGTTNVPVSVNTINGGCVSDANGGYDAPTNPQYYVDNHDPNYSAASPYSALAPVYNIQYDGTTVLLTAQVPITANVTNHVKIAIADYQDSLYDSAVFLKAWKQYSCQCQ